MKLNCGGTALAVSLFFSGLALAGPVVGSGVFALSGTVTGTTTGLDFYVQSPGDQTGVVFHPTLGAFASLVPGTQEIIQDLTAPAVIPGMSFDFQNWIQLTDGINLDATRIPVDSSIAVCVGMTFDGDGDQCRPNAQSPIVLTQGNNGVSARVEIDGQAHFSGSSNDTPFVGLFNSPSTQYSKISDLVTAYNANGGIPNISYTAQFTTTTAVPEPLSLALASLGLFGLAFAKAARRSHDQKQKAASPNA